MSAQRQLIRQLPNYVGLTTHWVSESAIPCLRAPARTFFGTGIHAPKNVCHNGGLLEVLTRLW